MGPFSLDDWFRRRPWVRRTLALGLGVLLALVIAWQARTFVPFFADDGFISLRYAQRFAHGQGLTWTAGDRVEGYSNLLWVLLIAPLGRLLRDDYVLAARAWGLLGAALAAAALPWFRKDRPTELLAGLTGGAIIAATPAISVWSIGGLEQPIVAALLAIALGALAVGQEVAASEPNGAASIDAWEKRRQRHWRLAGACFALLALTRPDGLLFTAVAALAVSVGPGLRARLRRAMRLALPAAIAWGAQLAFRRLYYRDWVPNTAYAKVAFTSNRLTEGAHYLSQAVASMPILAVAPVLGVALLFTRRRSRVAAALAIHLAWALYVIAIGGDIFPAYRHAVPLIVTSAVLVSEAAGWALAVGTRGRRLRAAVAVLGLPALVWLLHLGQRPDAEVRRAHEERWEWAGEPIGLFLKSAFAADDPLMAVDPAGCLPYFSGLRALDMLGLNDRFLSHHRPPDFGHGPLAHELGDGGYVARRHPDLIVFCLPWGNAEPCFRSGRELRARLDFTNDYTLVQIEATYPRVERAQIWMRREGATGVVRGPTEVRVPAVLLSAESSGPARLGPGATVELPLLAGRVFRYDHLPLPAGRWRAEAQGPEASAVRGSVNLGAGTGATRADLGADFTVSADGTIDLEAWADPGRARVPVLQSITLRRQPESGAPETPRVDGATAPPAKG